MSGAFTRVAVAAMMLTMAGSLVGTRAARAPFALRFPPGVDLATVQGIRRGVLASDQELVIETTADELLRGRLKLLIFVPGYRFAPMDIDLARDAYEVNVPLTPLKPIHVTGHVLPVEGVNLDGAKLHLTMHAGDRKSVV